MTEHAVEPTARPVARTARWVPVLALLTACSGTPGTVAPPRPVVAAPVPAATSTAATPEPVVAHDDPAAAAVRAYLREQALAINAGTADPAAVPAFTGTLTEQGRSWALPLLAANLGDRMPGPYPLGVLGSTSRAEDRVDLSVCLQDRGWQVDRGTGQVLNQPRFSTASAVVLRRGDRWLVDDVVLDGGSCTSTDVVAERF